MSYARNPQPQILSIQAIIQKSQFKSKILNNIPVDIKKLFMQQISKPHQKLNQQKRMPIPYENVYSQTIQHAQTYYNNYSNSKKRIVPPLPSSKTRQIKSQSLNSSKNGSNNQQKMRTVHTTRTNSYSRQAKRITSNRNSFNGEQIHIQKTKQNPNNNLQNKEQQVTNNQNLNPNMQQNKKQTNQKNNKKHKFFNTFEYQLVLPDKNAKDRGFRKITSKKQRRQFNTQGIAIIKANNSYQPQDKINTATQQNQYSANQQQKLQQKYQKQQTKLQQQQLNQKNILQSQKTVPSSQSIPDFVLAALNKQTKKISPLKNIQSAQYFQFNLQQKNKGQQKMRLLKPPQNVLNMKKKISYNKIRRSQQSVQCEQGMQPKVNFIKLIQKQREKQRQKQRQKQKLQNLHRKNSQILSRQKKVRIKQKLSTFQRVRTNKKINSQEQVKGWDVPDAPQFFEQY